MFSYKKDFFSLDLKISNLRNQVQLSDLRLEKGFTEMKLSLASEHMACFSFRCCFSKVSANKRDTHYDQGQMFGTDGNVAVGWNQNT